MNKIHRRVEYALMALKHMQQKRPGQLTSAKEISDALGIPFDATSRSLQIMAGQRILQAEQGAHGGYLIVRDLERVTLYDLMEMILGSMGVAKCLNSICEIRSTCNIVSPVQTLNRKLGEFYRSLTLAELVGDRAPGAVPGKLGKSVEPERSVSPEVSHG